jgi:hypothetical protein
MIKAIYPITFFPLSKKYIKKLKAQKNRKLICYLYCVTLPRGIS